MRNSVVLFFFLTVFFFGSLAQSISGIVNSYAEVTNVNMNSVDVVSTFGFSEGDKVLLIQMKGASIMTGNIPDFGTITALNNAGNFEFGVIESINGLQVVLETEVCHMYDISGRVQLVKVPVYSDITISGLLTAEPWNGVRGGIVAIEATNSISLGADIDVSGLGFLGGDSYSGSFGCSDPNWANMVGGEKGEGIADPPALEEANRAPLANGGGGSNRGNPGAGGGGNGGPGGRGGNEWYGSCALNVSYGIGGYDLDYTDFRAFMGGGGGGGYRDNNLPVTAGANGGGIVFLIAPLIEGNNFSVDASGTNVAGISDSEGAGGGGAGGCVYVLSQTINSPLEILAEGGSGGDILSTLWQSACHGPGGGGGGGAIVFSEPSTPLNITTSLMGGSSGMVLHTGPACAGTPHGSEDGSPGQLKFDYQVYAYPDLGEDTTICQGDTLQLLLPSSYLSIVWSTGSTDTLLLVDTSGIYWVDVELHCGIIRDSIEIEQNTLDLGVDQEICNGTELSLDVPSEFTVQAWNTGQVSQSILVDTSGVYTVTATDDHACLLVDSVEVNVLALISSSITEDACVNEGYDFNGNVLFISGLYSDTLIASVGGCDSIVNLDLNIVELPVFSLSDTSVCFNSEVHLVPEGGAYSYAWIPENGILGTDGSMLVTGSETTMYYVTGTDEYNCSSMDSLFLSVIPLPNAPSVSDDALYCINEAPLPLLASGSSGSYTWYLELTEDQGISSSDTCFPSIILGETEYYVVAIENGCEGPASSVSVFFEECPIVVPTCFSPNYDQINDSWELLNIDLNYPNNTVKVYNRWGNLVYESSKGSYSSNPWDGRYNGEVLPVASYHYIIEFNDNFTQSKIGTVTIIE